MKSRLEPTNNSLEAHKNSLKSVRVPMAPLTFHCRCSPAQGGEHINLAQEPEELGRWTPAAQWLPHTSEVSPLISHKVTTAFLPPPPPPPKPSSLFSNHLTWNHVGKKILKNGLQRRQADTMQSQH